MKEVNNNNALLDYAKKLSLMASQDLSRSTEQLHRSPSQPSKENKGFRACVPNKMKIGFLLCGPAPTDLQVSSDGQEEDSIEKRSRLPDQGSDDDISSGSSDEEKKVISQSSLSAMDYRARYLARYRARAALERDARINRHKAIGVQLLDQYKANLALPSPMFAVTYEPGHLLDYGLEEGVFDTIQSIPGYAVPPSARAAKPNAPCIAWTLLSKVPGGKMRSRVIAKTGWEWLGLDEREGPKDSSGSENLETKRRYLSQSMRRILCRGACFKKCEQSESARFGRVQGGFWRIATTAEAKGKEADELRKRQKRKAAASMFSTEKYAQEPPRKKASHDADRKKLPSRPIPTWTTIKTEIPSKLDEQKRVAAETGQRMQRNNAASQKAQPPSTSSRTFIDLIGEECLPYTQREPEQQERFQVTSDTEDSDSDDN